MARISGYIFQVGKGEEAEPELSIVLAFSGSFQVERIQHHNQAPSTYLEFRQRLGEGLYHLCGCRVDGFDETISLSEDTGANRDGVTQSIPVLNLCHRH